MDVARPTEGGNAFDRLRRCIRDLSALNAGANSFVYWDQAQGHNPGVDSGTPAVGDAVVLFPPGTTSFGSASATVRADHVGLIVGVDASTGSLDIVNGDWYEVNNYTVAEYQYANLATYASDYANGEVYAVVSPGLPSAPPPPPPAPPAAVSDDSAGNFAAFINSSGKLAYDTYSSSSGWSGPTTLPGTPRSDSPVVVTPDGTAVFFIESNGDIANDYLSSGTWEGPGPTGATAIAGSALTFSPGSTSAGTPEAIAFQNPSGTIENDYRTSSGWAGPGPIPGAARTDTPITFSNTGHQIFYVNASGAVTNAYYSSASGWQGPAVIGGTAAVGTTLAFSPGSTTAGTPEAVAFQNPSGAIENDYDISGWQGPGLIPGSALPGTPVTFSSTGAQLFYVNVYGNVTNDYYSSASGWQGPADIGGSADNGTPIVYSPGATADNTVPCVFFIDSAGNLVNDYDITGSGWEGPGQLPGTPQH
jgi:hypothetical protein